MDHSRISGAVELKNINITDEFWRKYQELVRTAVIPYQREALNDRIPTAEPSHAIRNFRVAAGEIKGEFQGMVFQDSDIAKWLEAVGYMLSIRPDAELEGQADELIELIGKAQQPDGYLNTYFIVKEPDKRWKNLLECHELYCAGHLIEAAVAYYQGTGKKTLLDIMCRYADYIDSVFGREDGKIRGYDGHEEIELALVKLYRATGIKRYLDLACYFIDERGQHPSFFMKEWEQNNGASIWTKDIRKPDLEYYQAHRPVREQTDAVGHAVRAVYLYAAMADLALETGDAALRKACRTLWDSIESRQLYITGGIGSTHHGEAFTFDYDLPNDTVYQETCASIGLMFFAHRMLKLEPQGAYADVMERALYNSVISGMGQEGRSFFYVNPLEVLPEASLRDPGKRHVKAERQKWYGCACCPPNLARLLASLGSYIYTVQEETVYTHLFIGGEAVLDIAGGKAVIEQQTNYPWSGGLVLRLREVPGKAFTMAVRIPGWCRKAELRINGVHQELSTVFQNGYALLNKAWAADDTIELQLEMPGELIQANPRVTKNAGKVAIQRGPLVYCLEEADNGRNLAGIEIDASAELDAVFDPGFFGGAVTITGKAFRTEQADWEGELYRLFADNRVGTGFRAIPYYLWANRGPGEMQVWTRVHK